MTDLITGTGRFNLVGTCTGIAAAVNSTATGRGAARPTRQLSNCRWRAAPVRALWLYLPESRLKEYLD
jgi:hypothetical protein